MDSPETEPMKNPFKLDLTVNLPALVSLIGVVAAGSMWVGHVENKINNVAELITQSQQTAKDIADLQSRMAVMDARGEQNQGTLARIEGRLASISSRDPGQLQP